MLINLIKNIHVSNIIIIDNVTFSKVIHRIVHIFVHYTGSYTLGSVVPSIPNGLHKYKCTLTITTMYNVHWLI